MPLLVTLATPQLSLVLDGLPNATPVAEHCPRSVLTVTSAGQMIDGGSVSLTVTLNEQLLVPQLFELVQFTVLVPTGNTLPEAGVQVPEPPVVNVTMEEHRPEAALEMMSAGQVRVGRMLIALGWLFVRIVL